MKRSWATSRAERTFVDDVACACYVCDGTIAAGEPRTRSCFAEDGSRHAACVPASPDLGPVFRITVDRAKPLSFLCRWCKQKRALRVGAMCDACAGVKP